MTDEKNPQEAKVRSGLSAKRNPVSYQVMQDIVIPAGTILRSKGGDIYSAQINNTDGIPSRIEIEVPRNLFATRIFRQVIAA